MSKPRKPNGPISKDQSQLIELFDANPTGLVLVDAETRIIQQVNTATAKMIGLPADQIVGKVCHGFFCPADSKTCPVLDMHQEVDRSERILITASGEKIPILKTVVSITLNGHSYLLESFIDITERKRTEQSMIDSETKYRILFESACDGILIADAETRQFLFANPRFCEMFGYTEEELKTMSVQDIHPPESLPHVIAEFEAQFRGDKMLAPDIPCLRKDGSVFPVDISTTGVQLQGRSCNVGFFRDISERKQAETRQQQMLERLTLAQQAAGAGMWEWDLQTQEVTWSPELFRLAGLDPDTDTANFATWRTLLHPEDRAATEQHLREAAEKRIPLEMENRIIKPSGEVRWFHSFGNISCDQNGTPVHMAGICLDVTDRKQSDTFLSLILNNIPDFVFWKDRHSVYQGCNQAFARAAGLDSPEQIVGKTDPDLAWKKEEADFFIKIDREVMESDQAKYHIQEPQQQAGGKQTWVETCKVPLHDGQGQVIGILGTYMDITERKQAEDKIRRLSRFPSENPNPVMRIHRNGTLLFANDAAAPILKFWEQDVGVSIPAVWQKKIEASLTSNSPLEAELICDGHILSCVLAPVQTEDYVNLYARDITIRRQAEEALRESEQKYRLLFENAGDAIYIHDQDGIILAVNSIACTQLGYTQKELLGMYVAEVDAPSDADQALDRIARLLEAGHLEFASTHRCKNGKLISVEVSARQIQWEGSPAVMSISRDITSRKQAEAQIRLHAQLLDSVKEAVVASDLEGRILYWGRGAELLYGYTAEEVMGQTYRDFAGSIEPVDEDIFRKAIIQKGIWHGEHIQKGKDGKTFWTATFISLVRNEQGEPAGFIGIDQDISVRKRAEERLEKINAGLLRLGPDSDQNIQQLTALCGELLGATCAIYNRLENGMLSAVGQWNTPPDFLTQDNPEGHICHDVIQQGKDCPLVITDLPSTPYATTDLNVTRYKLKTYWGHGVRCAGQMTGSLCVVFQEDVQPTEEDLRLLGIIASSISNEEERKRAKDQQAHLEAELQQAQKLESVGRLAGGVAHDFNNMLGVILGRVEMAAEGLEADHPLYEDLQEIQKAAERSADFTRQLLAFARKQTVAPQVLNLNETVEKVFLMLKRLIGENIELVWHPLKTLWPVRIDPTQIDQLLTNLCVNARDAITGIGQITIETGTALFTKEDCDQHDGCVPGDYVMLSVRDTGEGMEEDTLQHIFEPFFTTKAVGEGTGLGLATAYGAVHQNNGFIDVDSELGEGTLFRVYLPRHIGPNLSGKTESADSAIQRGQETVLVVEDEPTILSMTTKMLARQGYDVLSASTPGEAIRLAREQPGGIDLLITDVVMPEMNGRDLAKNLILIYPDLKRLFMSGYTADVIAHNGVLDEGVSFIQKPFAQKELAAQVRQTLDGIDL
jgi:PAS domain S-box-containing protein